MKNKGLKTPKEYLYNFLSTIIMILIGAALVVGAVIPSLLIYNAVANGDLPTWVLWFLR